MTDNVPVRKSSSLGWTGTIILVALAAGFYFGITSNRNVEAVAKPTVALLLILSGMLLLFPLAAFGPRNDFERKFRLRTSANGAGNIVFGVAQLIPNGAISLTLGVISLLFMLAVLRGIPGRFFASRV